MGRLFRVLVMRSGCVVTGGSGKDVGVDVDVGMDMFNAMKCKESKTSKTNESEAHNTWREGPREPISNDLCAITTA